MVTLMTNDAAAAGAVAEGEPKDTGSDMRLAFQFSAGQSGRGRSVRVTRTNGKLHGRFQQSHRLFQRRLGPARFERRSTIIKRPEIMVGRRGEAPLVAPDIFFRPNKALALNFQRQLGINGPTTTGASRFVWRMRRWFGSHRGAGPWNRGARSACLAPVAVGW